MSQQNLPNCFAKSHGLGNDYLVVDPDALTFALTPDRVRLLCDRHIGIGGDGVLSLQWRDTHRFGLRIQNPDGSDAEKSGNGIRIFAKWLVDTGRATIPSFEIETAGGIVPVAVETVAGELTVVTADMGTPVFREDLAALEVDGADLAVVALSIGNPHCVVPRERLEVEELRRIGPQIETHAAFPQRTNVQLVRVTGRNRIEMLIWERGAGETLASGSSACAAAAAAHRRGWVDGDVTVAMPGGELAIRLPPDGHIWMRGPVEEVGTFTLGGDLERRLLLLA